MTPLKINDIWYDTFWETKRIITSISPLITRRVIKESTGPELYYTWTDEATFRKQMTYCGNE